MSIKELASAQSFLRFPMLLSSGSLMYNRLLLVRIVCYFLTLTEVVCWCSIPLRGRYFSFGHGLRGLHGNKVNATSVGVEL